MKGNTSSLSTELKGQTSMSGDVAADGQGSEKGKVCHLMLLHVNSCSDL